MIDDLARKITQMKIRGAGAMARAAVQALGEYAISYQGKPEEFRGALEEARDCLLATRPTSCALRNAIRIVLSGADYSNVEDAKHKITENAGKFINDAERAIKLIGEMGSKLIEDDDIILTHCNSSAALSVIKRAARSKSIRVFATESRPWLQGHITVREFADQGIDVTMIVDSAVRHFIKKIDKVFVGADAVTSSGAVVNKIGTSQIALCAHEHRVPFYVCTEIYKFSPETLKGERVPLELRSPEEIANPADFPGVKILNPVFDVTPPDYIHGIITERGLVSPYEACRIIREVFL